MKIHALPLILGVFLGGCVTTQETDPTKISTGDLLFGQERLNDYLQAQEAKLAVMEQDADEIKRRLVKQKEMLEEIDEEHIKESQNLKRLYKNKLDIENDIIEKILAIEDLEKEIAGLRSEKGILDRDQQLALASAELELDDIRKEMAFLEQSLKGTMSIREKRR